MSYRFSGRITLLALALGVAGCRQDADRSAARLTAPRTRPAFDDIPLQTCPQGGYATRIVVDPSTTQAGDGWHFTRITDAIAAVRSGRIARGETTVGATACRITIDVAPGTYTGGLTPSATQEVLPFVLDVPRVTLQGGLRMSTDAKGRATGAAIDESDVTVLQPSSPLIGVQPWVIVTDSSAALHGDGVNNTRGDSVTVRGFDFRSGYAAPDPAATGGGFGVFAMRANGLIVQENRFGFLLGTAVDIRAGSARIALNSAADLGSSCAICVAGPGIDTVIGNTVARSGQVGILGIAATQSPLPVGVRALTVVPPVSLVMSIANNYVTGEKQHPVGTAIRVSAIGQAMSNTTGQQTTATLTSNELVDNRFGVIADGGFPPLNTSTTLPTGNLTLSLSGNVFSQSCQANLLVALARHTRALGLPTATPNAGYLKQSAYNISLGGDLAWSDVWFSHLSADNGVALQNTLTVDGASIQPGAASAYDAAECNFRPSANAWIGLKNSDDVGTKFDLLTEIRRNGTLVASGQANAVNGGSSGFNNAVQRTIATSLNGVVAVHAGDTLAVTLSARIAQGVSGHTSGTARLWYGSTSATSRIATLVDSLSRTYYLAPNATLQAAPGTGTSQTADVLVKLSGGNPFKPFGTWTTIVTP